MHTTCCCLWPHWKNKLWHYTRCCTAGQIRCRPGRCRCRARRCCRQWLSFRTVQHLGQEPRWSAWCRSTRTRPWRRWGNRVLGIHKAERKTWTWTENWHKAKSLVSVIFVLHKSPKVTDIAQTVSLIPDLLLELIQYPSFQINRGHSNA